MQPKTDGDEAVRWDNLPTKVRLGAKGWPPRFVSNIDALFTFHQRLEMGQYEREVI